MHVGVVACWRTQRPPLARITPITAARGISSSSTRDASKAGDAPSAAQPTDRAATNHTMGKDLPIAATMQAGGEPVDFRQTAIPKRSVGIKATDVLTPHVFSTAAESSVQLRKRPKFSFLSDPKDRAARSVLSVHTVPNNTPKPLLPMWASSLTSPQLGKQRLRVENWISMDSMGTLPEEHVVEFLAWLRGRCTSSLHAFFLQQVEENIEFYLRSQYTRGLIARKGFKAGDVILSFPLPDASSAYDDADGEAVNSATHALAPWGLVLNSETLQRHSLAAQRRVVPSYATIESIVGVRKSAFDPVPHPLFVDQVYCALFLACERAEGPCSPLYPYLRLISPFDDDFIRELHHGVLDPATHLEYSDHCGRFSHWLRQIHQKWLEAYEIAQMIESSCPSSHDATASSPHECREDLKAFSQDGNGQYRQPPPSMEDLTWAFRFVLSRQRLFPIRKNVEPFERICTERKRMQVEEDAWTRLVSSVQWTFLDRVFGVIDHKRAAVNEFDPHTIASVVPVLDMLQHPPGGVANTAMTVEFPPAVEHEGTAGCGIRCAVIRALEDIEEGDELTALLPKCYSLSYTLYRFGFLPLRRRVDDAATISEEFLDAHAGTPAPGREKHPPPLKGRHNRHV
ncbi:hypothetical protein MOQ_001656 [Trypanosoma cruzi marinkellei]|uniref:SET domain-containing protein n=1 Tax=Trypanosoma cruzi marinkellei TaxID=85056 RepID=K2MSA0_TRYCR|nr:hypothetical protein MOQ_001656 [Trypanosoma cruzi marinkellei]